MGWPPSSFCWAAASPRSRRRLLRRRLAAALPCRHFLRCRWVARVWWSGDLQGGLEVAAADADEVVVEDPAVSDEAGWHRPRIWGGWSLGVFPSRWFFFAFKSSSSELVAPAAHQRLRARSSSVPVEWGAGGLFLRRLRRWRAGVIRALVVVDGLLQLFFLLLPLCFFGVCIRSCKVSFSE